MNSADDKPSTFAVSAVELASPPFWENDPLLWFAHLESTFYNCKISSDNSKYHQLMSRLPQSVSSQVRDIIACPPPDAKYDTLKQAIIQRITPSDKVRLQQLFRDLQLGDRMPSALLRQMQQLLGTSSMDEGILREMWMQRLPESTQAILAVASALPLTAVAELADRVMERHQPANESRTFTRLSPVTAPATYATSEPSAIDVLSSQIASLQREVEKLSLARKQRSRSNSSTRRTKPNNSGFCFYHTRFGNKARKCQQPCSFSAAKQGNFQAGP
ncbi:unnamed protein product [Dicrocoelium dendriticum]|nr:unnamed protein product [Dicrocoelium dendriticum]